MRIALADYGAGNLRSVSSALERAGARPSASEDPVEVERAPLTVIAGVGNTGAAARGLEERGLGEALLARVRAGRPVLGICVGMQLLFGESEEGGAGLGILPGRVERLRAARVPHMGWNELCVTAPTRLLDGLDGEDVYFAHSYAARSRLRLLYIRFHWTAQRSDDRAPLAGQPAALDAACVPSRAH